MDPPNQKPEQQRLPLHQLAHGISHFTQHHDSKDGPTARYIERTFESVKIRDSSLELLQGFAVLLCRFPTDQVAVSHITTKEKLTIYVARNRKLAKQDIEYIGIVSDRIRGVLDGNDCSVEDMMPVVIKFCKAIILDKVEKVKASFTDLELCSDNPSQTLWEIEAIQGGDAETRLSFNYASRYIIKNLPNEKTSEAQLADWMSKVYLIKKLLRDSRAGKIDLQVYRSKKCENGHGGINSHSIDGAGFVSALDIITTYPKFILEAVGLFKWFKKPFKMMNDLGGIEIREIPFEKGKYHWTDPFVGKTMNHYCTIRQQPPLENEDIMMPFKATGQPDVTKMKLAPAVHPLPAMIHQMLKAQAVLKIPYPGEPRFIEIGCSHLPCLLCCLFACAYCKAANQGLRQFPEPWLSTGCKPDQDLTNHECDVTRIKLGIFCGKVSKYNPKISQCNIEDTYWKVPDKIFPVVERDLQNNTEAMMKGLFDTCSNLRTVGQSAKENLFWPQMKKSVESNRRTRGHTRSQTYTYRRTLD